MNEIIRRVEKEIEDYRALPRLGMREHMGDGVQGKLTDPLNWWKNHVFDLPALSKIARMFLCIPATSAPSERVFSVAGLTITKLRASLDSDNASCLVFVRDNWDISEEFKATLSIN